MDGIEAVLRLLNDGDWHRLDALVSELGWTMAEVKAIVELLSDQGFVHYRSSDGTVRLDPELLSLMRET